MAAIPDKLLSNLLGFLYLGLMILAWTREKLFELKERASGSGQWKTCCLYKVLGTCHLKTLKDLLQSPIPWVYWGTTLWGTVLCPNCLHATLHEIGLFSKNRLLFIWEELVLNRFDENIVTSSEWLNFIYRLIDICCHHLLFNILTRLSF